MEVASAPPAHTGAGGDAEPAAADVLMDGGAAGEVQAAAADELPGAYGPAGAELTPGGGDGFFDGGASEMQPGQPTLRELLEGECDTVVDAGGDVEELCELLDDDDMSM